MLGIIYDPQVNLSAPSCRKFGFQPEGHHNFDTENILHDLSNECAQTFLILTAVKPDVTLI